MPWKNWKEESRFDWRTNVAAADSYLGDEKIALGASLRMADAMELIAKRLGRIADLLDPEAQERAAKRRAEQAEADRFSKRYDSWREFAGWHRAKRLARKAMAYFKAVGPDRLERAAVKRIVDEVTSELMALPDGYSDRDPTDADREGYQRRFAAFDPAVYDWSAVNRDGESDLIWGRWQAVLGRMKEKAGVRVQ